MNIQQRVEIASMHLFFRPFTVMEILRTVNKYQPPVTVRQVLRVLCDMTRAGKLVQLALGKYEWKR